MSQPEKHQELYPLCNLLGQVGQFERGLDFKPTPYAAFGPIHSAIYRWQQCVHRQSGSEQSVCCGPSSHPIKDSANNHRGAPYHRYQTALIIYVLLGLIIRRWIKPSSSTHEASSSWLVTFTLQNCAYTNSIAVPERSLWWWRLEQRQRIQDEIVP